jgi:hypothetical protein
MKKVLKMESVPKILKRIKTCLQNFTPEDLLRTFKELH